MYKLIKCTDIYWIYPRHVWTLRIFVQMIYGFIHPVTVIYQISGFYGRDIPFQCDTYHFCISYLSHIFMFLNWCMQVHWICKRWFDHNLKYHGPGGLRFVLFFFHNHWCLWTPLNEHKRAYIPNSSFSPDIMPISLYNMTFGYIT